MDEKNEHNTLFYSKYFYLHIGACDLIRSLAPEALPKPKLIVS